MATNDAQSERQSGSENSSNTAFDQEKPIELEKKPLVTSTSDPIYEPVAPLDEIKSSISEFIGIAAGLTAVLLQVAHPIERIYQEFSYLGTSLSMPPEYWPKDTANANLQSSHDQRIPAKGSC